MTKQRIVLTLLIVLFPAVAGADRHKAFFGRVLLLDRSTLQGFQVGTDLDWLPEPWTVLLNLSYAWGSHEDQDLDQFAALAGPRYTYGAHGVEFFGHGQLGGIRQILGDERESAWAFAVGGGVDFPVHSEFSLRLQADSYWVNVQSLDWYPQLSISVVFSH